jgi:hypothetical protein
MRSVRPIPINPGGLLDIKHIVGRTLICDEILETLETRSVVLTGERRMGKTSLARLIEQEAPHRGWTVIRQSAEGFTSLDELAEQLIVRLEERTGALARAARSIRNRTKLTGVGPVGIAIDLSADRRFEEVVDAAVAAATGRLLLILDELPLFARALNDSEPTRQEGIAALHLLRRLREAHAGLRMLCLGSVGFHHVIRDASGVLNDTARIRLGPLTLSGPDYDAQFLARCLLRGSQLAVEDEIAVADAIATEVEGAPYYIHKVVESAEQRRSSPSMLTRESTHEIVDNALTAPDDPWDLRHYRDRVKLYYSSDAQLARAVLDAVAAAGEPLDFAAILRRVSVSVGDSPVDEEQIHDIIERLEDDHYLVRTGATRSFAFRLVKEAWIELRR